MVSYDPFRGYPSPGTSLPTPLGSTDHQVRCRSSTTFRWLPKFVPYAPVDRKHSAGDWRPPFPNHSFPTPLFRPLTTSPGPLTAGRRSWRTTTRQWPNVESCVGVKHDYRDSVALFQLVWLIRQNSCLIYKGNFINFRILQNPEFPYTKSMDLLDEPLCQVKDC